MTDRDTDRDTGRDMGTSRHNLSTDHQKPGDAGRPGDTLDRPAEKTHAPREFDPVEDVGRPEPGRHADG